MKTPLIRRLSNGILSKLLGQEELAAKERKNKDTSIVRAKKISHCAHSGQYYS